ncbi:MAG: cob(I)yrinic acid a,c-diamide adenosyltransferase [Bacteroidales bacterium]|nr:cob(I)yrinic acid a,c-diamide adenosyltransferase [Bacteroidales bacterium]
MIQIYTGNGKGKTTAAIGAAIRASGAGMNIFMAQFVKGMHYSELEVLKTISNITLEQYGRDCFIEKEPTQADIEAAQKGWDKVKKILKQNKYDMVILDELCIALYYKLIDLDEVLEVLRNIEKTEIIITGRYAADELIETADLVTKMHEIKHPYNSGTQARKGIEY